MAMIRLCWDFCKLSSGLAGHFYTCCVHKFEIWHSVCVSFEFICWVFGNRLFFVVATKSLTRSISFARDVSPYGFVWQLESWILKFFSLQWVWIEMHIPCVHMGFSTLDFKIETPDRFASFRSRIEWFSGFSYTSGLWEKCAGLIEIPNLVKI